MELAYRHFVVSNYNTFPIQYLNYPLSFTIYDQSDDKDIVNKLKNLKDDRILFCAPTCGHNLLNYLDFIIDNYFNLPDVIVFTKGNMPGRHCDEDFFQKAIQKSTYEFLWNSNLELEKDGKILIPYPGNFMEINNSWFVDGTPHRYFISFDDYCAFLFKNYKKSKYILFSPGACYQVERSRILNNPKSLYEGLRKLIEYDFRTAECFMLERSLNLLWDRTYELNDYCYDKQQFYQKIASLPNLSSWKKNQSKRGVFDKLLMSISINLDQIIQQRNSKRNRWIERSI